MLVIVLCSYLSVAEPIDILPVREPVQITAENVHHFQLNQYSDLSKLPEYLERYPHLKGLDKAIIDAQDTYEVNGIFLLAIIRLESGNGTSRLAKKQNNLAGIKRSKHSYRSFASKEECIYYTADLLHRQYLTEGGRYYYGKTVRGVNIKYCSSFTWAKKIEILMVEIQRELNNLQYQYSENSWEYQGCKIEEV